MPRSSAHPLRSSPAALAAALALAAGQAGAEPTPAAALLAPETGVEASFQLGAPQTFALGAGVRRPRYGAGFLYQPGGDDTFLASSWALATRLYFDPIDLTPLVNSQGAFFVGLVAGQYEYAQLRTGGGAYVDPLQPKTSYSYSYSRRTRVKGTFVAPHVGLSLFEGKGHHLDAEIGWFRPLSHRRDVEDTCVGDPSAEGANCAADTPRLTDPTPSWVRKSGLYVTLLRYVWRLN